MTNLNGVEKIVYVQPKEKKGKTALKHVANAAITLGGLYGTSVLTTRGFYSSRDLLSNDLVAEGAKIPSKFQPHVSKVATKIHRFFQSLGEVMFKDSEIVKIIEKDFHINKNYGGYLTRLKNAKGAIAMFTTLSATALALVIHGIYKAGKINGEAK